MTTSADIATRREPWLALAIAAAPAAWWLVAPQVGAGRSLSALLGAIVLYPLLEELCFRGLLQGWLLQRLGPAAAIGPLSAANVLTSVAFAAGHLHAQPPAWAAATLLPSLALGWVRERYGRVWPAVLLHAYYNAGLMLFASMLR